MINLKLQAVKNFKCLANECPDSCCAGSWNVPVEQEYVDLYEKHAKSIGDTITMEETGNFFKKNSEKTCVNFKNGLCTIHSDFGENFLPKTCRTYPKIIKKFGNFNVTSLSLSCIESVSRIFLLNETEIISEFEPPDKNLLAQNHSLETSQQDVLYVNNSLIRKCEENIYDGLKNIIFTSRSFDIFEQNEWPNVIKYIMPSFKMNNAQNHDITYLYEIIQFLLLMLKSTGTEVPFNLKIIINNICQILNIKVDFDNCDIIILSSDFDLENSNLKKLQKYNKYRLIEQFLATYLKIELFNNMFPYGNQFNDFKGKTSSLSSIIIVKFIIMKLAFLSNLHLLGDKLVEKDLFLIITTMSKILDHFPNSDLIIKIIDNFGWNINNKLISAINIIASDDEIIVNKGENVTTTNN